MKITLGELFDSLDDYPRLFKCHGDKEMRLTWTSNISNFAEQNREVEVNSFSIFGYDGGIGLEVTI